MGADASGRYLVPRESVGGVAWTELGFDDSSWLASASALGFDRRPNPTLEPFFGTDVGEAMHRENSSVYLRLPFVLEGDPDRTDFVRLRMRYADGFIAYLNGVELVRDGAPDAAEWDARATGRRREEAAAVEEFVTPMPPGLLRAGPNVLALHGLNDRRTSPDFLLAVEFASLALSDLRLVAPRRFFSPSPGLPNGTGYEGVSRSPRFSVGDALFFDAVTVELEAPSADAAVHLTVDGSPPSARSPRYERPFELRSTTRLQAIAIEPNRRPSPPQRRTVVVAQGALRERSSELAMVVASRVPGTELTEESFAPHSLMVWAPDGLDGQSALGRSPSFVGRGGLRIRGSSTRNQAKPSLALETWDERDEDRDVELLGMPAESDWVLYAPYTSDPTLIRNAFAYALSNAVGRYAVRTRFVELFLSAERRTLTPDDYSGVYVLMEKIKRGDDRVSVSSLPPSADREPEISGGYILKIDRPDPGDVGFQAGGLDLKHVYPKEEEVSAAQARWLQLHFGRVGPVLDGPEFADPERGYRRFLDVGSWIDFHILNEFAKNPDGFVLSTFLSKERGERVRMGPIWDFDLTYGPADGDRRASDPEGWSQVYRAHWYRRLFEDPTFEAEYRARWWALREGAFAVSSLHALVDRLAGEVADAQGRNFLRWGESAPGPEGWEGRLALLKRWLAERASWIDTQLLGVPEFSHPGGAITPPLLLSIRHPTDRGELYVSLDGTDPRAADGSVAVSARRYEEPVTIAETTRVRARIRVRDDLWSDEQDRVFVVDTPTLALSEIHFDAEGGDAFDFVELINFGPEPVALDRAAAFVRGVFFEFSSGDVGRLAPGERVVVVADLEAFASRYEVDGVRIAGEFRGAFSDRGETIAMVGALTEPLFSFRYSGAWFPETAAGHSLELRDPVSSPESWSEASSWRPSAVRGGSPGRGTAPGGGQRPGDTNGDGRLNLTDVVEFLRHLFDGVELRVCGGAKEILDSDGDGAVAAADALYTLRYLFGGGPPPVGGVECVPVAGCEAVCTDED